MGFFTKKWIESLLTGSYTCPECGGEMYFEDDNEETLICDTCGFDQDIDDYGIEDEEYEDLYPRKEDLED